MMTLEISDTEIPQDSNPLDDTPPTDSTESTGDFNPEYPGSTPEAPYGYFPDGRIRKRRPYAARGTGGSSRPTVAGSARADTTARTAAAMLARMNGFVGLALMSFGMPLSGAAVNDANTTFEEMAYQALQTDPALARKILSAGATSGKAQLTMAYVMFTGTIAPVAYMELKERRDNEQD